MAPGSWPAATVGGFPSRVRKGFTTDMGRLQNLLAASGNRPIRWYLILTFVPLAAISTIISASVTRAVFVRWPSPQVSVLMVLVFTASVVGLFWEAAAVIGTHLQQDQEKLKSSLEELELRNKETNQLGEMIELLQSCQTPEEGHTLIARDAQQLFPSESGAVYAISASRRLAEAVASWGDPSGSLEVFSPEDCWALRLGKAHFVEYTPLAPLCKHITKPSLAGCLCVPMVAQGEVYAVLHLRIGESVLAQPEEIRKRIIAAKQQLAATFAERIGLSLANLRLREQLRQQSIRDPLTGLFNRTFMEESLERELSRAARSKGPLGIIMVDVDHFKRFNDTFGHDAGDLLLREVGYFFKKSCRPHDIPCRYGGEEFLLILVDASLEDTVQRAEQLRVHIRDVHVTHKERLLGPITISLGVVAFPKHGENSSVLLKQVDDALYRAKGEGRDRVVVI